MTSLQRLILGDTEFAFERGQSVHGRWRVGYARAAAPDTPTSFALILDAGRLVFVLAEGPAAPTFAAQVSELLWTLESTGDDWPAPLIAVLDERARWQELPAGELRFVAGHIDRQLPVSYLSMAWLGLPPARLLDRALTPVDLGAAGTETVAHWSPATGVAPYPTALGRYRGSLFGMERLLLLSPGAERLATDLPDLTHSQLQQALQDWRAEAPRDLLVFDVRLAPALAAPLAVLLTCRWVAPDLCELRWNPSPNATGYRLETARTPDFDTPELLAELTDGRQIRYLFSPPLDQPFYARVVPLNQGIAGPPSAPVCPLPLTLIPPVPEPVCWSADGGYLLTWTPIAQATGYEVQEAPGERFEASETTIVYRGDRPECRLPLGTPPGHYYRVRALNALYAPGVPSPWSEPVQAPLRLDTPVFSEVTGERLAWMPVTGAQSYVVRVVLPGQDERQGDEVTVAEPAFTVARTPATYRVRALRQAGDPLTASEWSAPVTIAPPAEQPIARSAAPVRPLAPLLWGVALVSWLVGAALGIAGLRVYLDANATATPTPLPAAAVAATHEVATLAADRATEIAALQAAMQRTLSAGLTRTHQPSLTPSPTLTFTPSPTPSPTANGTATRDAIVAAFAADLTRTAIAFTATPSPTLSLTPSTTPDLSATAAALAAEALGRCALVNRDGLALPVRSGPYAGDRLLTDQAPWLAHVIEIKTLTTPQGAAELWLQVRWAEVSAGWLRVPPGADLTRLIAGDACPR